MKKILACLLFIFAAVLPFTLAGTDDRECVAAFVQDISPSSVGIDDEFTIGINLESCANMIPENVRFEILSVPPDIIVTENLVTEISRMFYATSERLVRYHMKTTPDAKPGPHVIRMRLSYGSTDTNVKDYEVEIRVTGEDAEPRISSVATSPEYIYEGDTVDLRLGIENHGDAFAKSVAVSLDHGFKGIKDATIGTLGLDGSKTASFKFKAGSAGGYTIPVNIKYEDDFGLQEYRSELKITVLERKGMLNIASVKVDPVLPYAGDIVELTMRVENFGARAINSIRVYADHPFNGLKESFIGTLDPNEDGPAVVTFIADKPGEYEIPVTITYSDDFGEERIATKVNVIVLEKDDGTGKAILSFAVLGVIGGLIYMNYRTKKNKDEVIRQLMKGTPAEGKKR